MPKHKKPRVAVILAAGKGTRMRSRRPKVLHEAAGRPMLGWVLEAARRSGCERLLVIVGHGADEVRERFAGQDDIVWVTQAEQLGTGHALAQAEPHVPKDAVLLVLSGDVPRVRAATLDRLAEAAEEGWGSMAVAEHEEPGSLGRVIADGERLARIVEASDASPEELAIRCINAGIYALPAPDIFDALRRLDTDNAKGEYYLTDALGLAAGDGLSVALVDLEDPSEAFGVNSRRDLARVHQAMLRERAEAWMDAGVTVLDPATTHIEPGVEIGMDTVVHPGVSLLGTTRIGEDCEIHQGAWIRDSTVADGAEIHPYSLVDGAEVGPECGVGPFARLRPGTILRRGAKVGNFVEIKKSELGEDVKASHLTYLGDAAIGAGSNIGAGVVTCNYDGWSKFQTEIGAGVFVGSDTMLVAPVRIGDGATVGAGSVITQDVPEDALAVGRGRQRNIPEWSRKRREKHGEK